MRHKALEDIRHMIKNDRGFSELVSILSFHVLGLGKELEAFWAIYSSFLVVAALHFSSPLHALRSAVRLRTSLGLSAIRARVSTPISSMLMKSPPSSRHASARLWSCRFS